MSQVDAISPQELMKDVIERLCDTSTAAGGVVIGPANDEQQQAGVIQMVDAGQPAVEIYLPLITVTVQIRALAGTLDQADAISRGLQRDLNGRGRTIARQASTDRRYLIHSINVTAGPSMHYDTPETRETLLFAELRIGNQPIIR